MNVRLFALRQTSAAAFFEAHTGSVTDIILTMCIIGFCLSCCPSMQQEKEYGKLNLDQFRDLVRKLPEIRGQMNEFPRVLRERPTKLKEILGSDFHWAGIYENNFIEQIAILFVLMGWDGLLAKASRSDDPQASVNQWLVNGSELDQWYEANKDTLEKRRLILLSVILQRNILSIMLHHRPLSALVDEVRRGGDNADDSFFKAVRVDRSILSCPTFSDRLAHAELIQDKSFFLHLRSALKGPLKKHWETVKDLRYAIAVLREFGFDSLSDAQLEDLFVKKLKLYPPTPSARKNLRRHLYEGRKLSTT